MPRFRDETDFPDYEPVRGGRGPEAPASRNLPQRDPFRIARLSVDHTNETTVIGRRRVDDLRPDRSQALLDAETQRPYGSARPPLAERYASRPLVSPDQNQKRRLSAQVVGADRRFFNLTGFPKTTSGNYARTVATPRDRLRFLVPSSVIPCIQRKTRREVLFAKRAAGGAGSRKRKRRTSTSHIGC